MDYEHYHIYIVEGAEQLAKLAEFEVARQAASQRQHAFILEHKGVNCMMFTDGRTSALLVKEDAPANALWREARNQRNVPDGLVAVVPVQRSKLGRSIATEMYSLSVPVTADAAEAIGAGASVVRYIDGQTWLVNSQCYVLNGRYMLVYPKEEGKPIAPEFSGCRLLKLSEFYAMKEAEPVGAA